MNKKILVIITIILFLFSIYKTCDLLDISFANETSSEENKKDEINNTEKTATISKKNTFQTDEFGIFFSDNKYIYYNNNGSYVRQNISSKEENIVSSNMTLKNITDADENIIGVATIANNDDILKDYIVEVSKDGIEKTVFYKTECSYITSIYFDEENIYYTNETHNIYKINIDSQEISVFYETLENEDYPILIGIKNNNLFYVNGTSISCVDLSNKTNNILTNDGCSYLQKPILINDCIYYFTSLSNNSISCINIETKQISRIINENYLNQKTNYRSIDNFNVIDNYLFLNVNGNIYYCNLKDKNKELTFYKKISSLQLNVTNDSIFFIDKNNIEYIYVNWLISQ